MKRRLTVKMNGARKEKTEKNREKMRDEKKRLTRRRRMKGRKEKDWEREEK